AGDEALRTVAKRLHTAAPGGEPPARIGADAFGLLLTGLRDGAQAAQAVERILTQTFSAPITFEGVSFRLSAKAGIALHPENGLVSTQQFVALLEETGLIVDTGRFVLLRVLEDIARWRSEGLAPPRIAVNVSAVQLRRGGFFSELSDLVSAAGGHAAGVDV